MFTASGDRRRCATSATMEWPSGPQAEAGVMRMKLKAAETERIARRFMGAPCFERVIVAGECDSHKVQGDEAVRVACSMRRCGGAGGRTRTGTALSRRGILSLDLCLILCLSGSARFYAK